MTANRHNVRLESSSRRLVHENIYKQVCRFMQTAKAVGASSSLLSQSDLVGKCWLVVPFCLCWLRYVSGYRGNNYLPTWCSMYCGYALLTILFGISAGSPSWLDCHGCNSVFYAGMPFSFPTHVFPTNKMLMIKNLSCFEKLDEAKKKQPLHNILISKLSSNPICDIFNLTSRDLDLNVGFVISNDVQR